MRMVVRLLVLATALGGTQAAMVSPAPARTASPPGSTSHQSASTYTLHHAAAAGDLSSVDLLLAAGLPCDEVDDDGRTPLHEAVANEHVHVAQLLLSRGAVLEAASGESPLMVAAKNGDAAMLSALRDAGAQMDEETAHAAFWAAVSLVDNIKDDEALSAEVPRLLRHVFEADFELLLSREKLAHNVTCMQPKESGVEGVSVSLGYLFDYDAHAALPLKEGRRCEAGRCCDACSRVTFPHFALPAETDFELLPELSDFNFQESGSRSARTILGFVRLVERIRRTVAHELSLIHI